MRVDLSPSVPHSVSPAVPPSLRPWAARGLLSTALATALLSVGTGCGGQFSGKDRAPSAEAGAGGADGGAGEAADGPVELAPSPMARLTSRQYQNVLDDIFGPARPVELQADTAPYLFTSIGASTEPLGEQGVQLIEAAAQQVTGEVFADAARREALLGCAPTGPADDCVRAYLARLGLRAWRRPLDEAELSRWLAMSELLAEGDVWRGVQLATAGMLQSPAAVYRVELGEPDPEDPSRLLLTDYELASRLSFVLWNTGPDEALLAAAAEGRLRSPEGLRAEALRLLADPRADEAMAAFFEQYLDLGRLDRAQPDPTTFPQFTPSLRSAMRAEVLLLVDQVVNREDGDLRGIFSNRRAFDNSELAAHYGLEAEGAGPITFVPLTLPPDSERAGILGLGAFLTMNAHAVDNSPTLRGKYVMERILCYSVPPPPGDVSTDIAPATEAAPTLRARLAEHRENPECSGCHSLMDPPGLVFERFDPIGGWRDSEAGYPIDTTGELLGEPLSGPGELADRLAESDRIGPCVVKQLYRHAHGRLEAPEEAGTLEALSAGFAADGHRFRGLLLSVVTHESFRAIAAPVEAR